MAQGTEIRQAVAEQTKRRASRFPLHQSSIGRNNLQGFTFSSLDHLSSEDGSKAVEEGILIPGIAVTCHGDAPLPQLNIPKELCPRYGY